MLTRAWGVACRSPWIIWAFGAGRERDPIGRSRRRWHRRGARLTAFGPPGAVPPAELRLVLRVVVPARIRHLKPAF
jgi:hypothetical protein